MRNKKIKTILQGIVVFGMFIIVPALGGYNGNEPLKFFIIMFALIASLVWLAYKTDMLYIKPQDKNNKK